MRAILILLGALIALLPCAAQADWDPGDPYKMHYPQLPDPTGWDVKIDEGNVVADDFQCTKSGPISQIHFWGSWRGDQVGTLANIHLSIHADVSAAESTTGYSHPTNLLWEYNTQDHDSALVTSRLAGNGDQGWYDPLTALFLPSDHAGYYQYNIQIETPFEQVKDTIYWLDIHVISEGGEFGWKTTLDHWNDDAVIENPEAGVGEVPWLELTDPLQGTSLDMAFVIVPEPATAMMLFFGGGIGFIIHRLRRWANR